MMMVITGTLLHKTPVLHILLLSLKAVYASPSKARARLSPVHIQWYSDSVTTAPGKDGKWHGNRQSTAAGKSGSESYTSDPQKNQPPPAPRHISTSVDGGAGDISSARCAKSSIYSALHTYRIVHAYIHSPDTYIYTLLILIYIYTQGWCLHVHIHIYKTRNKVTAACAALHHGELPRIVPFI